MTKNKPAIHPKDSFNEKRSIGLLNAWIAETKRAMPDIRSNDRWPNIDGYIEITDHSGSPTGLLKVQVKKLNSEHVKKPKYSFSNGKFLTYCRECKDHVPILLIVVDLDNQKAYWTHITDEILKTGTKTIKFDKNQVIASGNHNFIKDWENITQNYQNLPSEFQKLKKLYSILSNMTTEAFSKSKKEYIEIHNFIDEINYILDHKTPIVKKIYYSNTWKLGFAYNKFDNQGLSYSLYPIPIEKNDIQIKKINEELSSHIVDQNLGFTVRTNNPILEKPKSYAYKVVHSKLERIIDLKLLEYSNNKFLAKEFIFAFIDRFHEQMDLPQKETYTIKEVIYRFYTYLPLWLITAYDLLPDSNVYSKSFYDPEVIYFLESKKQKIHERVKEKLEKNITLPTITMGNDDLPFDSMKRFLNLFSKDEEISRPYIKKSLSKSNQSNTSIYNCLSKEDLKKNIKTFLQHFLKEYDTIIQNNFSSLKEELSFFEEANLIVINSETKDHYKDSGKTPTITFYYLKSIEEKTEGKIMHDYKINKDCRTGSIININNNNYKILRRSSQTLDFMFEDAPMFYFIYKILREKLENYFSKFTNEY